MFEFLVFMLVPTMISASILFLFGIRRFKLEARLKKMALFILAVPVVMYIGGEIGVCLFKPWAFDCSKSVGFCPCGLPVEDALFSFLVVLNVAMATLIFSEIEQRSRNGKEFLERLFLLKD